MAITDDGELDDRMLELQQTIDERNARRQDDILKLVRSVWGQDAQIVGGGGGQAPTIHNAGDPPPPRSVRAPVPYQPDGGPAIPSGTADSMSVWPTPIESNSGGGGAGFSPVPDPMSESGGSDPFGDGNPDVVSTGAQIG
jgi:hypothetical protein